MLALDPAHGGSELVGPLTSKGICASSRTGFPARFLNRDNGVRSYGYTSLAKT